MFLISDIRAVFIRTILEEHEAIILSKPKTGYGKDLKEIKNF